MSIVFMECSIEMYYTKRSSGRSSKAKDTQKLSGRLRVSSENYYLPLPPGPLDTKSVIARPVPIMILLSGGPLSTACSFPTLAWLPRRISLAAVTVDSEWTCQWITAATCSTALMVAGQLRRLDSIKLARLLPLELRPKLRLVHATSESSRPTPGE
jgi:hypothetical protein